MTIMTKLALASCITALVLLAVSCKQADQPPPAPAAPPVITTPSGVTMVAIPAGSFEMGSAASREKDEAPHSAYVSAFYMDQYEVTQEHFEKVLGRNPSRWKEPKNPVEQIRWKDAAEYASARSRLEGLEPAYDPKTWRCNFESAGYRLPTEAEWEYACRAGTRTQYAFGDSPSALGEYAWFKENCTRSPRPVGGRKPNPWGLYDMYGNVWEWCNDFYKEDYYASSPERDPRGPPGGETRVLRGGCWNSRAAMCRSAYRNDEKPAYTDACFGRDVRGFVGFRCVRSQPGK
jgi:formylglycine-generating enzyme required for sulfatase activity